MPDRRHIRYDEWPESARYVTVLKLYSPSTTALDSAAASVHPVLRTTEDSASVHGVKNATARIIDKLSAPNRYTK